MFECFFVAAGRLFRIWLEDRNVLIVGLGNPGNEYAETRHNGWVYGCRLFGRKNIVFRRLRPSSTGLIADGSIGGEKVLLLKPQTYMNLSGNSVVKALHSIKFRRRILW